MLVEEFISKIVNISLYQADFTSANTKSSEVTKFIFKFLKDIDTDVSRLGTVSFTVSKNVLRSYIRVCKQILELREDPPGKA